MANVNITDFEDSEQKNKNKDENILNKAKNDLINTDNSLNASKMLENIKEK